MREMGEKLYQKQMSWSQLEWRCEVAGREGTAVFLLWVLGAD